MSKLSIMTITYDRWIPYLKCLKSIKPVLTEDIKLEIYVDSKLSKRKFNFKKFLTKFILGKSNYIYRWGGNYIGQSRDIMLSWCTSNYCMICDDDDKLNTKVAKEYFDWILDYYGNSLDVVNFDYHPDIKNRHIMYKVFNPYYMKWRDERNSPNDLRMGTSTIFSVKMYKELPEEYKFRLTHVDDMIPMYILYLKSKNIYRIDDQLIIRCRGRKSLGNTTNETKFKDLVYSCQVVFDYIKNNLPDHHYIMDNIADNIEWYSINKSGELFGLRVGKEIRKLINN